LGKQLWYYSVWFCSDLCSDNLDAHKSSRFQDYMNK